MNLNENRFDITQQQYEGVSMAKTYVARVFLWMAVALSITAFTAYYFASNAYLISFLFNKSGITVLGWIVTFSPFAFVLLMGTGYQRLSAQMLALLFGIFSILMGMSLSFILLIYTSSSVFKTFAVASGMFAIMSLAGYTTKIDLTKFGSIMFMGLIGIIFASLINFIMHSASMEYIISFLGVLIFTGLTAYDVQKLKKIQARVEYGDESFAKLTIMGALTLYLDFINLFLFLLRFLGNRR